MHKEKLFEERKIFFEKLFLSAPGGARF